MRRAIVGLIGVGVLWAAGTAWGEEWPQFRGPGGAGLSAETALSTEWAKDKNVLWKVQIPGVGWSSPIIWGDKVIVTTAITENQRKPSSGGGFGGGRPGGGKPGGGKPGGGFGGGFGGRGGGSPPDALYRWEIHCLDRNTGKTLWKQQAVERKPTIPTHGTNTYASETPITDGERVYVYFGMVGLFCYDLDGKLVWKKDLGSYSMTMGWGTGSSPVLEGDKLFLQCDNEQKSFLVALDKKTGDEAWRVTRTGGSSWCTPFVWKNKIRTELVAGGAQKMQSYDPGTGKLLWELGGFQSRASASPTADEERVYFGAGGGMSRNEPLYAVQAGASGDITLKSGETSNAGVAWSTSRGGPPMASPLVYKGHLYVVEGQRGGGLLACYDAKTGKSIYKERLPGARGFTASPWAGDGKIYLLDEGGQTFVVQAGAEFKVVGKNMIAEMFWASPGVAKGMIFLRGVDHLYCIK